MVLAPGTPTAEPPAQYTGCHGHGEEKYVGRLFYHLFALLC